MNSIINNLKSERDYLLSLPYVKRNQNKTLLKAVDTNLIKVITGPRRAGKSTMAVNTLSARKDFFYINFDNKEVLDIENHFNFIKENSKHFKNGKTLFLDEVQNLEDFELLVSQLQRNGFNLVITGSNSNLLSRELSTRLTGRHIKTEVLPFSYSEAVKLDKQLHYLDYLKIGGFPEQLKNIDKIENYVESLFESIILKDIINRYRIRKTNDLLNLSKYFLNTPSQLSTFNKITNKLSLKSVNTVIDYYNHLKEAYIIFQLNSFSSKTSEVLKSSFKTYVIDTGIFFNSDYKFQINIGHLLENAVFLTLVRNGFIPNRDLFILRNPDNTEIDFIAKSNNETVLIQCSLTIKDESTRRRDFEALLAYKGDAKKYVICLDKDEKAFSTEQISVITPEELEEVVKKYLEVEKL